MIRTHISAFCCAIALASSAPAFAQNPQNSITFTAASPSYANLADQIVHASVIVDATIRSASKLRGEQALGVAQDRVRFLVQADVIALIRSDFAIPTRISYVVDAPLDARGKAPKLRKQRVLLFARPVAGHADQLQLVGLDGQRPHSAALDGQVRAITQGLLAADAPPAITGIGNAFHVPGSLPGEGETQIFLMTDSGAPVSLQILRRPSEQPRWSVSLSDIVDEAAGPPAVDTLLWYRLACGLPAALPADSLDAEDANGSRIAQEDYALVKRALGPCNK